jgi:hypothetical protein
MATTRLAIPVAGVKSSSTPTYEAETMDTVLDDLNRTREPLMQYRRYKRLLKFVRDTSAIRASEDAEAIAAAAGPEIEPRRTSRI